MKSPPSHVLADTDWQQAGQPVAAGMLGLTLLPTIMSPHNGNESRISSKMSSRIYLQQIILTTKIFPNKTKKQVMVVNS